MCSASKCRTCTVQALCGTAINITLANATTYDAQVTWLTCFGEKRESHNPATNQSQERNWLATSWEQALVKDTTVENAVADETDSELAYA